MNKIIFYLYLFPALLFCSPAATAASASESILILKSSNLSIVNQTAEAFKSAWHGAVDIYTVKSSSETINLANYTAVLAIGSKATVVLKANHEDNSPALYGLVLSPADLALFTTKFIGISSAPDFNHMFADLRSNLNSAGTLGVIYSSHSEYLVERLKAAAAGYNIAIEAKKISGKQEIAQALQQFRKIDLFYLIPDPILSSEESMMQIFTFFGLKFVPTIAAHKLALMYGASYVYAVDPSDLGKAMAIEAERALKDRSYRSKTIYLKGRLYKK